MATADNPNGISRKPGAWLYVRSAVYWGVMSASMIFFGVTGILALALPLRWRYFYITTSSRINIFALRWICGVRYRLEYEEGTLPQGPAIVLSKHQSAWETMAFTFLFPPQVWVLKKSLLRVPFFGWGLAMLKPIAIDRAAGNKALAQVVSQGRDRLERGLWIVIYPEGTRVAAGTKRRYKQGGSVLAAETGYPVLPVAHNAGHVWPRNSFVKFPGLVTVRVGSLIDSQGKTAQEINTEAEDWIERQMQELDRPDATLVKAVQ
ncbi:MAG: lysophospholipid acyltransferase family protein [bacterium]